MTRTAVQAADILEFWFGTPDDPSWGKNRKAWWRKDADFDDDVRGRFLARHEAAAHGDPDSCPGTAADVPVLGGTSFRQQIVQVPGPS